ncbi:MAG: NAD(P)/FAD-dependent oxidoreductase [Rhodobacteraceae bacterium]|nr:NAD(P)/FAD-dependent oxidoreductase [Paracoccaceae bacterium]
MSRFDAIVIGGGINGLVAAAVLGRRGRSVCLLERSDRLGGMAGAEGAYPRMAHLLYNLGPLVRKDIGLGARDWPFRTVALPTVALNPGGAHVRIDGTEARFVDGRPHPDAAAYRALVTRLGGYGALLRRLAEAPPPGGDAAWTDPAALKQMLRLGGFGRALRQMGKAEMRGFLKVLLSNAYDLILDELPDGPLAGALAADAVRGLAMGPRSPGTVFSLVYRHGHGGTVSLPVGGMAAVVAALAEAARAAGATIRTGTAAARLLCEGDRVIGVETGAGEVLMASRVLSSAAPLATARMAGLDRFDIEASRRMRLIRARGTVAKINLRLSALPRIDGLPDDLLGARLLLAPSAEAVETAFNPAKYRQMSDEPILEALLPGVTDPAQDAGGAVALSIIAQYAPSDLAGGWTDAARDRLLAAVVGRLAAVAPDLPGLVAGAEVLCPDRIEAETGAPGGHWHHAELGLDQLLTIRPANGLGHYAMGLAGLYLCGAATHPGGDVMGLSGRNAALAALGDGP